MMFLLLIGIFVATYFIARSLRPQPKKPQGMRVMRMQSRGFARIGDCEEVLPASPLEHGEYPTGVWASPEGVVYAVGKLYTGRPGPDEGVVWKRSREGKWSIAHRLADRTFHSIAGRSKSELVVGTLGGVVCFDGARWTTVDLPYPMVVKVWADGDELVAQAFDGSLAYRMIGGRAESIAPREEPDRDPYSYTRDGTLYRVFERSTELGEDVLTGDEERQIREEMKLVQEALRTGKGVRRLSS